MKTYSKLFIALTAMMLITLPPLFISAQGIVPFVDFHNYSAKKAFGSRHTTDFTVWDRIEHDCSYKFNKEIVGYNLSLAKASQANFAAMIRSNSPFACVAYESVEKGFMTAPALKREEIKGNLACQSGMLSVDAIAFTNDINYFSDYVDYYNYLTKASFSSYNYRGNSYSFSIIDGTDALKESIQNPEKFGVILTITGGHMLGNSVFIENEITESKDYYNLVLKNIARLKGAEPLIDNTREYFRHPILYISLSSSYKNGIVGSSQRINKTLTKIMGNPGHLEQGFTKLGREVVDALLSETDGSRILIDVSYMSLKGRQQYYQMVEEKNRAGMKIPIIAAHTGISGLSWSSSAYNSNDDDKKNEKSYLNRWRKNLSNEDITIIYESNGLIGISLNQLSLCGMKVTEATKKTIPGSRQAREVYLKAILANIFSAVEAVGKRDAWNILCIGSDFDSTMLPFPTYASAKDMPDLIQDITDYLHNPVNIFDIYSATDVKRMMYGMSPDDIVNKLFHENLTLFVEQHLPNQPMVNQFNGDR